MRHADETADAARPPASAAPVLGNRRLAVRRGNRHCTFSGSGFNGLRPVCMGGQPDAPPSLLPAGGCVRHRRLRIGSPFPTSPKSTRHGWKSLLTAAVTVEGVIVGSRGLPDQRLQIILDDVGPAEKEPLPGRMALTWQDMPDVPRPLPGQRITADLKIRPVHGFHNQGTWNSEAYWHRQGVFFQAWAKQDDAAIRTSGTPSAGAELRERLRLRVAVALDPPEESGFRTLSFPVRTETLPGRRPLPSQNAWSEPPSPPRREKLPSAPEQIGEVQTEEVREHSGSPAHSAAPADTRRFSRVRDGGSSIIPALLFGDRYGLNTPDMERINAAG
ncbi:MAG: DUF4131 domain-containing protein [Bilophila wadsworthia]